MKCPFRSYFNWLILVVYLTQLSFIFICCMKPSEIFDTSQDSSFWDYFESAWLYPPWIFGSKTLMMDSIFFFCINLIPFGIIGYSQTHIKKFNHQKHVNFWCSLVIRTFQQILTPIMAIPMTFRLSYLIEQIFLEKITNDFKMILSFVIAIINIFLHIIHTYFSSLFLIPIDFVIHSKADFYDGKYMTLLHLIRIIISISSFMFSYIKNGVVASIFIGIIFFICILTLYFRLTIQAHVSPIGQYLEVLPFFVCPFMVLFRYFIKNNFYSFFFLLSLFLFFGILFRFLTHFMVKQSLKAFSPFIKQSKQNNSNNINIDNEDENSVIRNGNNDDIAPTFLIGSVITVIRIVASECCDPDCLLRFLEFQKKSSGLKNSYVIEVVRFLALFPSRRKECLRILKNFHSKSNFNSFTVFVFKKILKSLDEIESTEKNLVCLNNFYRSFLVHKHLFWVARKEKKYFIASKEALSAAYFHIEVKNEFHYLLKRYTYDSFLHYYYADFCLSACGDFESYLKECQIARMLDCRYYPNSSYNNNNSSSNNSFDFNKIDKNNVIVDPLLHPMSINNPKILQFCSLEETKINIHSSNQSDFELASAKEASKKYEKSKPVATFLNEKKYLIPLLSILHIYIPMTLFLYVMGELYIKDHQIHEKSKELYEISVQLLNTYYIASSAVYLPYLSNGYTKNPGNETYQAKLRNLTFKYLKNHKKLKKEKMNTSLYDYLDLNSINNGQERFFLTSKLNESDTKLMQTFFDFPFYSIDYYSGIQPLGNMTGGMLFIFERYISHYMLQNYSIQQVLDTISIDLDNFIKDIFRSVYIQTLEIKDSVIILREISKDDLNGFYICKVAIVTICIFSVISCVVYIFQVNCIYRNDDIKIDFLSSDHVFSIFLLQESKKAWELLREYVESSSDVTTEISIPSARSSVNLSNKFNILHDSNNIAIAKSNSYASRSNKMELDEFTLSQQNQTEMNNYKEPLLDMTVNGHDFNKDLRSLPNSNTYIKIKSSKNKMKFGFREQEKKEEMTRYESNYYTSCYDGDNNDDEDNRNDNNDDICKQAIEISKATEKEGFLSCPYFHLVILMFAPLVFTVIIIAMFQIPLVIRAHLQEETFQNILKGESMANHSLIMLNATFDILEKRAGIRIKKNTTISAPKYEKYNEINLSNFSSSLNENHQYSIEDGKIHFHAEHNESSDECKLDSSWDDVNYGNTTFERALSEILCDLKDLSQFQAEKCYEFFDIVCMSVETALKTAIDQKTQPPEIASKCIPFIFLFSWNLFNDLFFSGVSELFANKMSNGTSFIVATLLLMLTFVHLSFSQAILLKKAFNSLFHFPDDFLKQPTEEPKNTSKSWKTKLPQNALVVTSLTESDEIYSVSDNSKEIINRNLNDLISLKMSEIFVKVPINDDNLCEFSITDKKKKTFRFSTEEIGCLTKTVLIEENLPIVDNSGEQLCLQKLHGFIPPHFAELYGKNDQYEFNFVQNFIICVRISDSISPQMVEKCFNAANHLSQNSISINIVSVDGQMITFSSISKCKLIVILLLLRDFIDLVLRNTKENNCIYSIYVHYIDEFKISVIDDDDEPYLRLQPFDQNYFKIRLFQIENGKIAFSETAKQSYPLISKITEKDSIIVDFEGNNEPIFVFSINQLETKIVI